MITKIYYYSVLRMRHSRLWRRNHSGHLRLSIFIYKSITCLVLPDIVNISVGKHRRKDIDTWN